MTIYEAGDYTNGGIRRTCILDEGAITVGTAYTLGGGKAPAYTFATEISIGMVVSVSTDTGNTWANTGGSIMVNRVANNGDLCFGVVISEPEWEKVPASTTAADSLAKRLAGKYHRVATVWFPTLIAMTKATLVTANAANVVPGTVSILDIDVSACTAGAGITVNDIASGGCANICSMHYQAQAADTTVPIMIGFFGGPLTCAT